MSQEARERSDAGFTLVEALVAIAVLVFGLIAVSNLMIVAGTSNSVANRGTLTAALASQQMELLKAVPFNQLVAGGDIEANVGAPGNCTIATGTYNCTTTVQGVGRVRVRWQIAPVAAANTFFIVVRAESTEPLMGARTRAEFTTFRVRS